jgi:hypothetical protein
MNFNIFEVKGRLKMKKIRVTLTDTNYTKQAITPINLNKEQFELLKTLIQKVEDDLYKANAAFIEIEGILEDPVKLTITEYEKAA